MKKKNIFISPCKLSYYLIPSKIFKLENILNTRRRQNYPWKMISPNHDLRKIRQRIKSRTEKKQKVDREQRAETSFSNVGGAFFSGKVRWMRKTRSRKTRNTKEWGEGLGKNEIKREKSLFLIFQRRGGGGWRKIPVYRRFITIDRCPRTRIELPCKTKISKNQFIV